MVEKHFVLYQTYAKFGLMRNLLMILKTLEIL